MTHALGIDVGTTNVKAAIVGSDGTVHATASRNLVADVEGERAELDAEAQWEAVVAVVAECAQAAPDAARQVGVVGVDSQYSSIVPVRADGTPVGPMRLWSDRRGTDRSFAILAENEESFLGFIERHGIPPVGGGLSLGHILHLQHDCPDVHAETAAYLEPMDYVNARLTGRVAANQATQFMSQLIDNRSLGQTAYDDVLLGWSGADATRLPPLLRLDEPIGTVRPEVADRLGIPTAVVHAAVNDTQAGSVATDAYRPGRGGLSIGTTSVLVDSIGTKEVDLDHEVLSCPSPFDDSYLLFAENGLGGKPLEHVLDNVVDTGGFDGLDDVLASVPAGSHGVLFLPWLRGSMAPANDTNMRGGYINMSLDTDRRSLVRATCEGVAHNLAWLLPHAEALTGNRIEEVVFVGGAARSAGWVQIVADVLGRPVLPADRPAFAIARGTALLALHRAGLLTRDELSGLVVAGDPVEPVPDHHAVHLRHQPQFEAAFEALRPIAQALNG